MEQENRHKKTKLFWPYQTHRVTRLYEFLFLKQTELNFYRSEPSDPLNTTLSRVISTHLSESFHIDSFEHQTCIFVTFTNQGFETLRNGRTLIKEDVAIQEDESNKCQSQIVWAFTSCYNSSQLYIHSVSLLSCYGKPD